MRTGSCVAVVMGMACAVGASRAEVIFSPGASSMSATSYIASGPGVFEEDRAWAQSLTPHNAGFDSNLGSLGITARSAIEVSNEWDASAQRLDVNLAMSASLARTGAPVPYREAQGSVVYDGVLFLTLTEATSLRFTASAEGERFDRTFEISLYSENDDDHPLMLGVGIGDSIERILHLEAGRYLLYQYALMYEVAWNTHADIDGAQSARLSLSVTAVPAPFSAAALAGFAMCIASRRREVAR